MPNVTDQRRLRAVACIRPVRRQLYKHAQPAVSVIAGCSFPRKKRSLPRLLFFRFLRWRWFWGWLRRLWPTPWRATFRNTFRHVDRPPSDREVSVAEQDETNQTDEERNGRDPVQPLGKGSPPIWTLKSLCVIKGFLQYPNLSGVSPHVDEEA